MFIFFLIIFLPLIEIIGFILIGGKIGTGLSLLWVIAAAVIGFTLLTQGRKKLVQRSNSPVEQLFDNLCIIAAALLLIFPGFISDFMALPLLIPRMRQWIFMFLKRRHGDILDDIAVQQSAYWGPENENDGSAPKTIEGDYKRIDEEGPS